MKKVCSGYWICPQNDGCVFQEAVLKRFISVLLYSYAHQERQYCNMYWLTWSTTEGGTETAGISTTHDQLTKSTFYRETSAASPTRDQGQNNPDAFIRQQIRPNFPHEKMWSKISSFGDSVWVFTSIRFASSEVFTSGDTQLHVHLSISSWLCSSSGGWGT